MFVLFVSDVLTITLIPRYTALAGRPCAIRPAAGVPAPPGGGKGHLTLLSALDRHRGAAMNSLRLALVKVYERQGDEKLQRVLGAQHVFE